MLQVPETELKKRLSFDNPWWEVDGIPERFRDWPRRIQFEPFLKLVTERSVQRAVVLMGPRRVGKTVLLTQVIQQLIDDGCRPRDIFFVMVDTPTYTGRPLEVLLKLFMEMHGHARNSPLYVIFDEIQYFPDWERHLKSLVDSYPDFRFVVSGSSAAALKLKSQESGAGRFTEFLLPPLTFAEFVHFSARENKIKEAKDAATQVKIWNEAFVDYLNYGGFPEAVMVPAVRQAMDRFVANDILDKVLLRDLPSLYGVQDTQELKRFFTTIAYNTGMEVSYEGLSQASGVAKNTIRKYLEYLEAAFLIHRLYRIDQNARRYKRVTHFKVYLVNSSIRAALFGPVDANSEAIGKLAETAFIGQLASTAWAHSFYYARWKNGEVDLVCLDHEQRPVLAIEIKWTDRTFERPVEELRPLVDFSQRNKPKISNVLTRTTSGKRNVKGIEIAFMPVAMACYEIPRHLVEDTFRAGIDPRSLRPMSDSMA